MPRRSWPAWTPFSAALQGPQHALPCHLLLHPAVSELDFNLLISDDPVHPRNAHEILASLDFLLRSHVFFSA